MKIAQKIALGFGLFMILVVLLVYLNYSSQVQIQQTNDEINTIYNPSIKLLEETNRTLGKTALYAEHIANFQTKDDAPQRVSLVKILEDEFPNKLKQIEALSESWSPEMVRQKDSLVSDVSQLFESSWDILTLLPDFNSYDAENAQIIFKAREYWIAGGKMNVLSNKIEDRLDDMVGYFRISFEELNREQVTHSESQNYKVFIIIAAVLIIGILISLFVIRSIIQPINELKETVLALGKGVYPRRRKKLTNDEIGEMTKAVNQLIHGLKKTKEFTVEVGKGNFETDYEPMSIDDELGHALVRMRGELANNERILERKVEERTSEMVVERERATKLYEDLNDSIEYAKRIQTSFLSSKNKVVDCFKDAFIMYKPKDKVSGDFFWSKTVGDKILLAAVDCTGHGVPGAFVSMVGNNVLNQISKVYTNPATLLNNLHSLSSEVLKKGREDEPLRDGMDIGLALIDKKNYKLYFAGAHNVCYVIRQNKLFQLKGDRYSIGSGQADYQSYTSHTFSLEPGDAIYLFSDGFADQFGGPKNKKYLIKKFREKLIEISNNDMRRQEALLEKEFEDWKGRNEQIDDILVIGARL